MKVAIFMDTIQRVDGNEEIISHYAKGMMSRTGDITKIVYMLDDVRHEMYIDESDISISVIRNMKESSKLIYRTGLKRDVLYETPIGQMELSFHTKQVLMNVPTDLSDVISLDMSYEVSQYGTVMMECELRIRISPLD